MIDDIIIVPTDCEIKKHSNPRRIKILSIQSLKSKIPLGIKMPACRR